MIIIIIELHSLNSSTIRLLIRVCKQQVASSFNDTENSVDQSAFPINNIILIGRWIRLTPSRLNMQTSRQILLSLKVLCCIVRCVNFLHYSTNFYGVNEVLDWRMRQLFRCNLCLFTLCLTPADYPVIRLRIAKLGYICKHRVS